VAPFFFWEVTYCRVGFGWISAPRPSRVKSLFRVNFGCGDTEVDRLCGAAFFLIVVLFPEAFFFSRSPLPSFFLFRRPACHPPTFGVSDGEEQRDSLFDCDVLFSLP